MSARNADRDARRILIVSHTARPEAVAATIETVTALFTAGVVPVLTEQHLGEFAAHLDTSNVERLGLDVAIDDIEVAIVLGGDGTILRAAEILRGSRCPIVGVNLGHVGFLAEMERFDLQTTIGRVLELDYTVEERMTLDVKATCDGQLITETWALNEASVEKRRRMLEVEVAVDDRAVSTYACDGVVLATPTGSTAYAFSAGGPIVWPSVKAMLLVPIAAHALLNRPLMVGIDSKLSVQILPENIGPGVMWCDGRRRTELPAGTIVEVTHSDLTVRLARFDETPFSDRLVRKFHLPVKGWRQGGEHA